MSLRPSQPSSSSGEPQTFVYSQPATSALVDKPMVEPAAKAVSEPNSPLLAPATAAATAASVGTLMQAVAATKASGMARNSLSIEEVVREELRLMLKEWMDAHLPRLVERIVRVEIERVLNQSVS